jgi:hypothetical protein
VIQEGKSAVVTLFVDATLEQVQEFYLREMEWFGWENRAKTGNEREILLYFEKPTKFCIISAQTITNQPNKIKITIGTGIR